MNVQVIEINEQQPFLTPWYYYRQGHIYEVVKFDGESYFVDVHDSPYAAYGATNHRIPKEMCVVAD